MVNTKTTQSKAPKAKKAKTAKVAKKVVETAPVVEKVAEKKVEVQPEVVVNSVDDSSTEGVTTIFESIIAQNENLLKTQRDMVSLLKRTWKTYSREKKDFEKNVARERRRAKKDPNRKKREPSGFAVATDISSDLCDFLNEPHGTKLSRTDVTRKVTAYIREKNLQVPENRRSFVPDDKLKAILGPLKNIDEDKGFTYFNLQRYITPHITSSASASASSSA